ncbi:MAG: hypothetical protein K2J77_01025 [Oscillospiraceae bacterium]|nr:hypothetical protein [Oscillospiraceae bacterium]
MRYMHSNATERSREKQYYMCTTHSEYGRNKSSGHYIRYDIRSGALFSVIWHKSSLRMYCQSVIRLFLNGNVEYIIFKDIKLNPHYNSVA